MSQKCLVADVFDNALENVNFGTKLTLTQDLAESTGKVIDIIYSDSGGMTTYSYVISVDNDTAFDSYQKVSCCFDVYSKVDTVTVPSDAVKQTNDRAYVNLLIDGTKIEQDVEIGIVDDDKTEILSGLSGGEEVIIN
jgi:hypothetical protein